jgi:hypothetical protein
MELDVIPMKPRYAPPREGVPVGHVLSWCVIGLSLWAILLGTYILWAIR